MPRNLSDIYEVPPNTQGTDGQPIESDKYNAFLDDIENDLNAKRPIVAGGTGAGSVTEALFKLGAERSSQVVTNYDTHVYLPGSFYSAPGATAAPVAGHAFVGIVLSSDVPANPPANQNVVLYARDQTDTTVVPARVYVRQKKAGVWDAQWSIDGTGVSGDAPPILPSNNMLWWDSETGQLYIYYNDGTSSQWVIASPVPDPAQFLLKAGDQMEGPLLLQGAPTLDLHAATKKYVDDAIAAAIALL